MPVYLHSLALTLSNSSTVFLIRLTPSSDSHFFKSDAKTSLCPTFLSSFRARHSSGTSRHSGSEGRHRVRTVSTQFSHISIPVTPSRKSGKQNFEQRRHSMYELRRVVLQPHWDQMPNLKNITQMLLAHFDS